MPKFARIRDDIVRIPDLDDVPIGDVFFLDLELDRALQGTGYRIRFADLEAAAQLDPKDPGDAEKIAALPPGLEQLSGFATLWIAMRVHGKPMGLGDIMGLTGAEFELLPEVEDHKPTGPTKAGKKATKKAASTRQASAPLDEPATDELAEDLTEG